MLTAINTIIYATDLGQGMKPAFRMAMSLAERYEAKVTFLNIVEAVDNGVYNYVAPDIWQDMEKRSYARAQEEAEKRITDFFNEEANDSSSLPSPEIKIIHGHAAKSILDLADELSADLIVMGSHGHSTLGSLVLGSVADKVMRLSKCPVLLIPTSG